jgi:16S rRNA (guanine527-N7)-methyltransferase
VTHGIEELAAASGLELSRARVTQLQQYLDLLVHWNATYNLTSVREPEAMVSQHLADCLAVVPLLKRQGERGEVLDVGSGGGLPGVVLAIACPGWNVTCVDAVGKKVAFLKQAAGSLGLTQLQAVHGRVEQLRQPRFDVVTARAFGALALLVSSTTGCIKQGGVWMAMKGRAPVDEMAALPAGIEVFHVEPVQVPGLDAQRCIVWMRENKVATHAQGKDRINLG